MVQGEMIKGSQLRKKYLEVNSKPEVISRQSESDEDLAPIFEFHQNLKIVELHSDQQPEEEPSKQKGPRCGCEPCKIVQPRGYWFTDTFGCKVASMFTKHFKIENSKKGFFSAGKRQTQPFLLADSSLDRELVEYIWEAEEVREQLPQKYTLHDAIGEAYLDRFHEVLRTKAKNSQWNGIRGLLLTSLYEIMPSTDRQRLELPYVEIMLTNGMKLSFDFQLRAQTRPQMQ